MVPGSVLRAVQAAVSSVASVWLVSESGAAAAGCWGLAKSVNAEVGQLVGCVHVADTVNTVLEAAAMTKRGGSEVQLALHGEWQAGRLHGVRAAVNGPVELAMNSRGALSALFVQPQSTQLSATLQVKAVGLNFRDVLNVLGMYPGDPGAPGGDCAGVACPGHPADGQDVLGLALGSLRSYAATDQRLLAVMPQQWTYEQASAMPTTWVTVWTALEEGVGLRSGCNVLVQAGSGGVGLVAVQLAQQAGALVYSTAGSAAKQAYVRALGVCMLSSTRNGTVFAAEMQWMLGDQEHLAAVLNSLSHDDYIPVAVGLLCKGGQFAEIGKRGIWSRTQMASEHVGYKVVAVDTSTACDPAWQQCALCEMSARVSDSTQEVQPLPLHVFQLRQEGVEAFRVLQRANQIGKVVVSVEESRQWTQSMSLDSLVVTGGTGGLGLLVGCWLLQCGMSQLVLLSRSGGTARGAEQEWERLSSLGTAGSVQVELCDAGSVREAQKAVQCGSSGIVHSAGVLADALLPNQTQAGLQRVWAPKAHAAWSLHQASCEESMEVDQFVLFSSVAALLGRCRAGQLCCSECVVGWAGEAEA